MKIIRPYTRKFSRMIDEQQTTRLPGNLKRENPDRLANREIYTYCENSRVYGI